MEIEPVQFAALAEFRHQIRKFLHFSEQSARSLGVEPQQHQLLLAIKGSGDAKPTVGYLAGRLQIRHHSAVELVDRMCSHGLVRRVTSPSDKRRVLVESTGAGNRVLGKLAAEHLSELRQTGPALVKALESLL
jgi:DNA-binding MarR family transcriptional regulator